MSGKVLAIQSNLIIKRNVRATTTLYSPQNIVLATRRRVSLNPLKGVIAVLPDIPLMKINYTTIF